MTLLSHDSAKTRGGRDPRGQLSSSSIRFPPRVSEGFCEPSVLALMAAALAFSGSTPAEDHLMVGMTCASPLLPFVRMKPARLVSTVQLGGDPPNRAHDVPCQTVGCKPSDLEQELVVPSAGAIESEDDRPVIT